MHNDTRITDAVQIAMGRARELKDGAGIVGYGIVELRGADGELKSVEPFANLITTAGDQYYATRAIAGVVPATPADATKVTGMKLGTGTTAVTKSSTAAALITYKTASNVVFDASFPTAAAVGGDAGWNANYKVTWGAGVATDAALTEAVIVNDAGTNATSSAANTISRVVFTAVNKGASDTLAITWTHKFLGA